MFATRRALFSSLLLLALTALAAALPASAATLTWKSPVSGNWGTATNWSAGRVPAAGDVVQIAVAGTYTVTVDVSAAVASVTVGGASGAQTLRISQSLALSSASTVGAKGVLALDGGTLSGAGICTVNGRMSWTSGSLAGTVVIAAGKPLAITTTYGKSLGGRLDNYGVATLQGSSINGNGGTLNNKAGATLAVLDGAGFQGEPGTFTNAGALRKTGTGNSDMTWLLNNTGNVECAAGALRVLGGGTVSSPGRFTATTPGAVVFDDGSYNFGAGSGLAGTGIHRFEGGTMVFSQTCTVSATLNWISGTFRGVLALPAGRTLNISSTYSKTLNGTMDCRGTIALTGANLVGQQATLNVKAGGLVEIRDNAGFTWSDPPASVISNAGTFRKSAGAGESQCEWVLNNTGAVEANAGTLAILGGGTATGTTTLRSRFTANAGKTRFDDIPYTFGANSSFTGTGTHLFTGATMVFNPACVVASMLEWQSGTFQGTLVIPFARVLKITTTYSKTLNGVVNNFGTITLQGANLVGQQATLNVKANGAVNILDDADLNGTEGTVCTVNNAGFFRKSAGTGESSCDWILNNTGAVEANAGTLALLGGGAATGTTTLRSRFTANAGKTRFDDTNYTFGANSSFTGSGTHLFTGATMVFNPACVVASTLDWQSGTFQGNLILPATRTLKITTTYWKALNGILDNSGTVTLLGANLVGQQATLNVKAGGAFNLLDDSDLDVMEGTACTINVLGTFRKSAGTGESRCAWIFNNNGTTEARAGNFVLEGGGASIGRFLAYAGKMTFDDGTYRFNAGTNLGGTGTHYLVGGTAIFNPAAVIAATIDWSGGVLDGTLTVPATRTLKITSTYWKALAGQVDLTGILTLQGSSLIGQDAIINVKSGGLLKFLDDADVNVADGMTAVINNLGTVQKALGSGQSDLNWVLNNTGITKSDAGTLAIAGGGAGVGQFLANAGKLGFAEVVYRLNSGARLGGPGQLFLWDGGLTCAGTVLVDGILNWNGGEIAGALTIAAGKMLNIATTYWKELSGTIIALGKISLKGNLIGDGGIFDIKDTGLLDIGGDFDLSAAEGSVPQIFNAGTIQKVIGTGISTLEWMIRNTGTVIAKIGTLGLDGGLVQTAGQLLMQGGQLASAATEGIQILGGILQGIGTITAKLLVDGGGKLLTGDVLGVLKVVGDFILGENGILSLKIGGTAAGAFDKLIVTGQSIISGILNLNPINGFVFAAGQKIFTFLFDLITGAFRQVVTGPLGEGLSVLVNTDATGTYVECSTLKPDLLIKKGSDPDTAYAGNDFYMPSPTGIQVFTQTVAPGGTVVFSVKVQNDGSSTSQYVVKAGAPTVAGWTVTYLAGSTGIGSSLTGSGYNVTLAAGASTVFTATLTAPAGATAGTTNGVTIAVCNSAQDVLVRDSVQASATVAVNRKVDLLIKKTADPDTAYLGGNIYNAEPAENQNLTQSVIGQTTAYYSIQVQNDGAAADSFLVKADRESTGYAYVYKKGTTDISAQMRGNGYPTGSLTVGGRIVISVAVKRTDAPYNLTGIANIGAYLVGDEAAAKDVVLATTIARAPDRKVDLQIKKAADAATAYIGNNLYLGDPAESQNLTQSVTGQATAYYSILVQNDGSTAGTFVIKASHGNTGYRFLYKRGTLDITGDIEGDGYATPSLSPGASTTIMLYVNRTDAPYNLTGIATIRAYLSSTDVDAYDCVLATTIARAPAAPPSAANGMVLMAAAGAEETYALLGADGVDTGEISRAAGLRFTAPAGQTAPGRGLQRVWNFTVEAPAGAGTVTLSWPNLTWAGNKDSLTLVDLAGGARRSMRTSAAWTFPAGSRAFQVIAEPRVEGPALVTGLTVTALRSNTRAVNLTLSAPAAVDVEVLSPAGAVVATVTRTRSLAAGVNQVFWSGPAQSGLYLLRVRATTESGTTTQTVRPVVVTR